MMRHPSLRPRSSPLGMALLAIAAIAHSPARANSPELILRQLFQANPVLAPYNLSAYNRGGQMVIVGAVGSKQIHDLAIRLAIGTGYPIRDDLVIDTALASRVALLQARAAVLPRPGLGPALGLPNGGGPYFIPPPLFGRLDDPFFGMDPPLVTHPPWWRTVAARAQGVDPFPAQVNPGVPTVAGGVPT